MKSVLLQQSICQLFGADYDITRDQIIKYTKMSVGQRLRLLEDVHEFLFRTLPPEKREILQKFHRGEF
jgi:hypothetical protein